TRRVRSAAGNNSCAMIPCNEFASCMTICRCEFPSNTPTMRSMACETLGECMVARRSEEHTSELQSLRHLVCRLLLEKKKNILLVPKIEIYTCRGYGLLTIARVCWFLKVKTILCY